MLQYLPAGDAGMIIRAGHEISFENHLKVRKIMLAIRQANIAGLLDLIPAYAEVMACYDPAIIDYKTLLMLLRLAESNLTDIILAKPAVLKVPVLYGGDAGPDLLELASRNNLTQKEVIHLHSSADYLVYMLGFTPGFCYLGGLNPKIAMERRQSPGLKIPAGSVGIAGNQTGIYPIESPGGWQIIGRTPLKLFDPGQDPVFLLSAGDYVRFFSVDENAFSIISDKVRSGVYQVQKEVLNEGR